MRGATGGGSRAAHGDDGDAARAARRHRLVALLATADDASGGGAAAGGQGRGLLGRVCSLAVAEVGVSGAGVTVMTGLAAALAGDRDLVWATSTLTERLEGLQLTTGEGPCLDAVADGAPVLVGDLGADPARGPVSARRRSAPGPRRCSRSRCRSARPDWAPWTCTATPPAR